jgi:hypothetical protein
MKAKKKFDPKVIQQFLIDHTEKFVVGLVAAVFLFFAFQSFVLPRYDKTTETLKAATASAQERVNHGGPANIGIIKEKTQFPEYKNIVDGARRPVDPDLYPMAKPIMIMPTERLRLRGAPKVFAVEELRATPGRGAMVTNQAGNAAGTQGVRWVVVTGRVSYKKQLEEYHSKFLGAAVEEPKTPQYVGFFVERTEVVPDAKGEPHWELSMFRTASNEAATKMGGRVVADIVDPKFVRPNLTSPLPQITNVVWGDEVVCPPTIPVAPKPAANAAGGPAAGGQQFAPPPPPPPARSEAGARHFEGSGHQLPRIRGGRPSEAPPGNPGPMQGNGVMPPPGGQGLDAGFDFLDAQPKPGMDIAAANDQEEPDYYLLRYFDFDVKPNKQYQYRIFPLLLNPNHGLDPAVLESAELADNILLGVHGNQPTKSGDGKSIWPLDPGYSYSPPFSSLPMSDEFRLLAGNVKAERWPKESEATIRILRWLESTGKVGNTFKDGLIRGMVLGFPAQFKIPGEDKKNMPVPGNNMLVDIQGGELVPQKDKEQLRTPGYIIVMDAAGNLVIHDELAETKEWEDAIKEPESDAPPPLAPGRTDRKRPPTDTDQTINPSDLDGDTPKPKSRGK